MAQVARKRPTNNVFYNRSADGPACDDDDGPAAGANAFSEIPLPAANVTLLLSPFATSETDSLFGVSVTFGGHYSVSA